MSENNTGVELEHESLELVDKSNETMDSDALKKAIEDQMSNLRRQSMLVGAQTVCNVILQKIYTYQKKQGKKTYRDYERLIADIQKFCETGISRKVDSDGTTAPVADTEEDT